jgi:hypothetical protein
MKTLPLVLATLACSGLTWVRADCIDILSTHYRIDGDWIESRVRWIGDGPPEGIVSHTSDSFNKSRRAVDRAGAPISLNVVSSPSQLCKAQASVGAFDLEMSARCAPANLDRPWGMVGIEPTWIFITVDSITRFRANGEGLGLDLAFLYYWDYESDEQALEVTLRDVTADITLLSLLGSDVSAGDPFWGQLDHMSFSIDPAHELEFAMSGGIYAFDFKHAHLGVSATFSVPGCQPCVPDTGASWLLLSLALPVLAWRRRHA